MKIVKQNEKKDFFYISGGMLEVQPRCVTVLADVVERARDLDEAAALDARKRAKELLRTRQSDMDYSKAQVELAKAVAQLKVIQQLRKIEK